MKNFHLKIRFVKHAIKQSFDLIAKSLAYQLPKILGTNFHNHDRNKRQVLILGYYGDNNYGDELMLKILLDRLQNDSTEISVVFTKNYEYDFSRWKNVFAYFAPKSKADLIKTADFFDEIILGGGAHIEDRNRKSYSFTPTLVVELTKLMLDRNKTVRWLGVSTNRELDRVTYIDKLRHIVPRLTTFTVRDNLSIDTLKNAGISTDNVQLVDDIAFEIGGGYSKIIGITLMNSYNDTDKITTIINDIVRFTQLSNEKWTICLLPFCNTDHRDVCLFNSIIERIDFKNTPYFIAPEFSNIETMLLMIKGCDLFINMKYHASLISLLFDKPTISVVYDSHPHYYNKMTYLHQRFNKTDCLIYFSKYENGSITDKLLKLSQ